MTNINRVEKARQRKPDEIFEPIIYPTLEEVQFLQPCDKFILTVIKEKLPSCLQLMAGQEIPIIKVFDGMLSLENLTACKSKGLKDRYPLAVTYMAFKKEKMAWGEWINETHISKITWVHIKIPNENKAGKSNKGRKK